MVEDTIITHNPEIIQDTPTPAVKIIYADSSPELKHRMKLEEQKESAQLEEDKLANAQKRIQEEREHKMKMVKDAVFSLTFLVLLSICMAKAILVVSDPNASTDMVTGAYGFLGTVLGISATIFFNKFAGK